MTAYARQAAAICREAGDWQNWGWVSDLWTIALLNRGDFSRALALSRDVVYTGQQSADSQVECWGLNTQGRKHLAWGQMGRAITLLQKAIALAEALPDRAVQVSASADLGRYEWLRGKPEAAKKWWRRALAQAEALGQRHDVGVILLEMGRRLDDRGHLERAEAILTEVGAEWHLRARKALEEME